MSDYCNCNVYPQRVPYSWKIACAPVHGAWTGFRGAEMVAVVQAVVM